MSKEQLELNSFHTIIFDFDGIFTDNFVYCDSSGNEMVRCSRSDSYGINLLKLAKSKVQNDLDYFVLSTETNPLVLNRCNKLGIVCHSGKLNKWAFLQDWLKINRPSLTTPEKGVLYFGNDLNDIELMSHVGASICPSDSHFEVKKIATLILDTKGGQGFVREGIEYILGFPNMKLGEINEFIPNR